MTDAQSALAQVREALEAYPPQGEWYANGTVVYLARSGGFDLCDCPRPHATAAYIAKCNPENVAAILAHVEAQEAENERLTAALQHEADCVEAYRAQAETMIRERNELRRQLDPMGEYTSADELIAALRAEKAEDEAMKLDAQRYRWLRPRFFAADFAYSDPPVCAIVFRWPESAKISANLDREIDAAMSLTRPTEES